jgi:outer membrane protein assembly factor BamD (BamD/ComL family)
MARLLLLFLGFALWHVPPSLEAAYLFTNGQLINTKEAASLSVEAHFEKGLTAFKAGNWDETIRQMRIVMINFPNHQLGKSALYYLGVAQYQTGELDIANKTFTAYLKEDQTKEHFEDVFRFKLSIAERFAKGERRHLFSFSALPKWQTGRSLSLEIFDEIQQALPNHEIAAVALLEKAALLEERLEFREEEKSLQQVIKRFPLTPFAKQAYSRLALALQKQAHKEPQNLDLVDLAEINKREFERSFGVEDPSNKEMSLSLLAIKEHRAQSLYETGQLFERKKKPLAAVIYYSLVVDTLKETSYFTKSAERLQELQSYADEMHLHVTH